MKHKPKSKFGCIRNTMFRIHWSHANALAGLGIRDLLITVYDVLSMLSSTPTCLARDELQRNQFCRGDAPEPNPDTQVGSIPGFISCATIRESTMQSPEPTKDLRVMKQNPRVVPTPAWLRPVIRWATRFSLNSPPWLPKVIKNAPLKMSSLVLRAYMTTAK